MNGWMDEDEVKEAAPSPRLSTPRLNISIVRLVTWVGQFI